MVEAPRDGHVTVALARPIGLATMLLGAGRSRLDSVIDPAVGVILHKKVGDAVAAGEPLCTALVNDRTREAEALGLLRAAYAIGPGPIAVPPLIVERL